MNSILSFENRGNYGKSNWRGNCSGEVIKAMLNHYRPRVFADVCEGSGTSRDVVKELNEQGANIKYFGLDLHSGFNLLKDSLTERIGGKNNLDYAFFHPPYADLLLYSGEVWGSKPHPDDLSRCESYEDFLLKMRIALQNVYEVLQARGSYSVLIGDIRKNGVYRSIQADLIQIALGNLEGIIIKAQHNIVSDRKTYSGNFIPIAHEYLLNFRRNLVVGFLNTTLAISQKLHKLARANWKAVIYQALRSLGGRAELSQIYQKIESTAQDIVSVREHWKARVRAELQNSFTSTERGVWKIKPCVR